MLIATIALVGSSQIRVRGLASASCLPKRQSQSLGVEVESQHLMHIFDEKTEIEEFLKDKAQTTRQLAMKAAIIYIYARELSGKFNYSPGQALCSCLLLDQESALEMCSDSSKLTEKYSTSDDLQKASEDLLDENA